MRFMILIKANPATEAGVMPDQQILAEMGQFNQQLVDAGVLQAGEAETKIEIRQVFEADDFGAELTPELREQNERMRAQSAARK